MLRSRIDQAVELMLRFAERTQVAGHGARRYLWTDAFAVCNFLGLERATSDPRHRALALRLVDRVHHVLGRHRPDDARSGWISELPEEVGEAHPTRGGLRIGKALPERTANEPPDPMLEWDRDGQYFHYLAKWIHALDQVTRATGDATYHLWARELCAVAHDTFTRGAPGSRRMSWKVSIDRSRLLVPSMGQHDPLEGFVSCAMLDATASTFGFVAAPRLAEPAVDFGEMLRQRTLITTDPLGLGGLLVEASRLAQLPQPNPDLVASLLAAAEVGLRQYVEQPYLATSIHRRLAFRELGLAIGLAALPFLEDARPGHLNRSGQISLAELERYVPLRNAIESFWLRSQNRLAQSWIDHEDINDVMLATCLAPDGVLFLAQPARGPVTTSHAHHVS